MTIKPKASMNIEFTYNSKEYALTHFLIGILSFRFLFLIPVAALGSIIIYVLRHSLAISIIFAILLPLYQMFKLYIFAKQKSYQIEKEKGMKHHIEISEDFFKASKEGYEFQIQWDKTMKASIVGPSIVIFFDNGGVFFIPKNQFSNADQILTFISEKIKKNNSRIHV